MSKVKEQTLRPFFSYFGGKWRAAPHYPAPRFPVIIEPFAGSAGYALRHYNRDVVLIEKDPKVAATWRFLLNATKTDILALPLIGNDQTVDDFNLPDGARWLIGWWLNKGTSSPCKKPSKWMRDGCNPTAFWGNAIRDRIASQIALVRHWTLIEGDYSAAPDVEATWFVDPPYQVAGRFYPTKFLNFFALGQWCKARQGQVIVCENERAEWLQFCQFKTIKAMAGRKRTGKSAEAIWTNENNDGT